MKQCPECNRVYTDDTLNFCLDDGKWLVGGSGVVETPTAVMEGGTLPSEAPTKVQAHTTDDANVQNTATRSRALTYLKFAIASALIVALATGGYLAYRFLFRSVPPSFANAKITRISASGVGPALSPDGRYVAFIERETSVGMSLWLRQIATGQSLQLIPPSNQEFQGVSFSSDSESVLYVSRQPGAGIGFLYRISVLGGEPTIVARDVDSRVEMSPVTKQIAFIRWADKGRESGLWIADADGSNERKIAQRIEPEDLRTFTWAADGRSILVSVASAGSTASNTLYSVNIADESQIAVSTVKWIVISSMASYGNDGLLITGIPRDRRATLTPQIWYLRYPDGELQRLTNEIGGYNSLTTSRDLATCVAQRWDYESSIWITTPDDQGNDVELTETRSDMSSTVAWLSDNKIVRTVAGDGRPDVVVTDIETRKSRNITGDDYHDAGPIAAPKGNLIAYQTDRAGVQQLWTMNADGTDKRVVVTDDVSIFAAPMFSEDGRFLIYKQSSKPEFLTRIPVQGGEAVLIPLNLDLYDHVVSPDGRFIAGVETESGPSESNERHIKIFDIVSGQLIRDLVTPRHILSYPPLRWSADGTKLYFVDLDIGLSNIWVQPIDGSAARQLTHYKTNAISGFDVSQDGKRIVVTRSTNKQQIVMISGLK